MSKQKQHEHHNKTWAAKLKRLWRQWSRTADGEPRPWYQSPGFAVFAAICGLIVVITIINYPNGMPEKPTIQAEDIAEDIAEQQRRAEVLVIVDEGYLLVNRGELELGMSRFHDALKVDANSPDAHFALMLACEGVIDRMGSDAKPEQTDSWHIQAAEHAKYLLTAYRDMKPDYQLWVGEAFINAAKVYSRRQDWTALKNNLSLARQVGFSQWNVLDTDPVFSANAAQPEFASIREEFLPQ